MVIECTFFFLENDTFQLGKQKCTPPSFPWSFKKWKLEKSLKKTHQRLHVSEIKFGENKVFFVWHSYKEILKYSRKIIDRSWIPINYIWGKLLKNGLGKICGRQEVLIQREKCVYDVYVCSKKCENGF